MEVVVPVEGAVETELSRASLDPFHEVWREGLELGIDRLGRSETERHRPSGLDGVAKRPQGLVDGLGVDGGLVNAFLFPSSKQDQDALVPPCEVGKKGGNGPAVGR